MNIRIQELAKQTGYIWHASGDPQIYEFTPEKLEKFAQLIVRECAKSANDWYQNHDKIHSDPMSYVLAHFGIEE